MLITYNNDYLNLQRDLRIVKLNLKNSTNTASTIQMREEVKNLEKKLDQLYLDGELFDDIQEDITDMKSRLLKRAARRTSKNIN